MCFCCIRRFYAFVCVCVFLWLWPLKIAHSISHAFGTIDMLLRDRDRCILHFCVVCGSDLCLWCRYCRCATQKSAQIKMFDIDFHYIWNESQIEAKLPTQKAKVVWSSVRSRLEEERQQTHNWPPFRGCELFPKLCAVCAGFCAEMHAHSANYMPIVEWDCEGMSLTGTRPLCHGCLCEKNRRIKKTALWVDDNWGSETKNFARFISN